MRLIDADALIKECHTIPDPKGKYFCLDIIERYEIEEAPTVCDINAIKTEIDKQAWSIAISNTDTANGMWDAYRIIDKYIKGENKNDNKRTETCNF